jgi:hypothetical protein
MAAFMVTATPAQRLSLFLSSACWPCEIRACLSGGVFTGQGWSEAALTLSVGIRILVCQAASCHVCVCRYRSRRNKMRVCVVDLLLGITPFNATSVCAGLIMMATAFPWLFSFSDRYSSHRLRYLLLVVIGPPALIYLCGCLPPPYTCLRKW